MTISKQEAADTLRDITKTERRTVSDLGYQMAWPHLIIWGVIWLFGYSAMAAGVTWDYLWLVLSGIGSLASFAAGYATAQRHGKGFDGRFLATFVVIFLFVSAVFIILPPRSPIQYGAFFPILVALYYALIGIWTRGWRMLVLGVLLGVLTLFGFLHLQAHFMALMAVVGGGGLILGGLWLRTA